jgi:uncharacterized protein (DUF3084 family)
MIKKIYILVPLIALAAFAFYYMGFAKEYDEIALQKIEDAKEVRKAEILKEQEERKVAIEAAMALNADRKAERAAKEAQDLAEKEARQAARDARDVAYRDRDKLEKQKGDLTRDITEVKAQIEEVEARKKLLLDEEKHLQAFVVAANTNVTKLQRVLQQIEDADKATKAAAALAAAMANTNSKK